jgi:hypothetical protein
MKKFQVEVVNFVEGAGRIELRIKDENNTILFDGVVYHGNFNLMVSSLVNAYAKNQQHKYEVIMIKE